MWRSTVRRLKANLIGLKVEKCANKRQKCPLHPLTKRFFSLSSG